MIVEAKMVAAHMITASSQAAAHRRHCNSRCQAAIWVQRICLPVQDFNSSALETLRQVAGFLGVGHRLPDLRAVRPCLCAELGCMMCAALFTLPAHICAS